MKSVFEALRGQSSALSKENFLGSAEIRFIMKNGDVDDELLNTLFKDSGASTEGLSFDNFVSVMNTLWDYQSLILGDGDFEDDED